MLTIEREIYKKGFEKIACIDEVGRGCLAGDVIACAIIMPKDLKLSGVNDSKKLSKKKREMLNEIIREKAIAIGIGSATPDEIDEVNIKNATHMAMIRAVKNIEDKEGNSITPDFLLVDAETLPVTIPQLGVIKGDAKSHGIAAASIVAKVERDYMMAQLHEKIGVYHFDKNAGYGTKAHIQAIKHHGTSSYHRKSFLKKILDDNEQQKWL
jgi:ribonuclease HII